MAIDKVYIFSTNEKRTARRRAMVAGGLISRRVPFEKIEEFHGPSHLEYLTYRELAEAAAAEFPEFEETLDWRWTTPAAHAQNWGYWRLFKQIQERGETAMWMHDDNYLLADFPYYEKVVGHLARLNPNFKCLALWSGNLTDRMNPPIRLTNAGPDVVVDGLPKGAGDQRNVVTPAFCEWFFQNMGGKTFRFENDLYAMDRDHFKDNGFYAVLPQYEGGSFHHEHVESIIHKHTDLRGGQWTARRLSDAHAEQLERAALEEAE